MTRCVNSFIVNCCLELVTNFELFITIEYCIFKGKMYVNVFMLQVVAVFAKLI